MQQFEIREYTEEDIGGILALFRVSFHREVSEEWFRWKYQYSPWGSKGYVVADGDMVVAFYGGIRLLFTFQGKEFRAYQFCDVMTHPKYRGRIISRTPLIVRLGELFYRENPMNFAYGFPSLRHARLQSLRLGGEGYRLVKVFKKDTLQKYPLRWKLKVKEGWEFFRKKEELSRFRNPPLAPFTKGGEGGLSGKDTLQLVKNKEYITWRYIQNPSKKYRLLAFKRMNKTKGYVVFTLEDTRFHVLEIMYERERYMRDILIALEVYILKNIKNINGIKTWFHPNEPVVRYLENLGYSSKESIPIAFKSVNKACSVTSEIFYDRYFYRMGDYDAS